METKMNPQPEPIIGVMLAFALMIFLLVSFAVGWVNYEKYTPKKKSDWDLFKIGEIYDEDDQYYTASPTNLMRAADRVAKSKPVAKPKSVAKPKPVVKPKPVAKPKPKDHPLFDDCVLALVSLGNKKTESKKIAADILVESNPSTIEEFIKIAYSKKT